MFDFVNAGIILMLAGSLLAYLRWVPQTVYDWLRRKFVVTVEIQDYDPSFLWVRAWLDKHLQHRRTGQWTVSVSAVYENGPVSSPLEVAASPSVLPRASESPRKLVTQYTPAPGLHLVTQSGRRILVTRGRRKLEMANQYNNRSFTEHFELSTFGARGRDAIDKILAEGQFLVEGAEDRRFRIWQGTYQDWEPLGSAEPRPLTSLVLPQGMLEDLLALVKEFLDSRAQYLRRGIPYRQGFLFEGEPGNGKSATVGGIAGHFGMDVFVAPLSSNWMDDTHLAALVRKVPPRSVLLMEDVDCAFATREGDTNTPRTNSVTLSGLLNVIDGLSAPEGRVLFMTTNHPEKLDPALLRPGRIDHRFHLPSADAERAARLFEYFYAEQLEELGTYLPDVDDLATQFAELALQGRGNVNMATLQGHLLEHKHDPQALLRKLRATQLPLHVAG